MDPGTLARVVFLIVALGFVIGGVGGLGYVLGWLFGRRGRKRPTLPDDPGRRLRLMEEELEQLQSEVAQLQEQWEFERRLREGEDSDTPPGNRSVA
jgi:hypothetical protein